MKRLKNEKSDIQTLQLSAHFKETHGNKRRKVTIHSDETIQIDDNQTEFIQK